jgi:hypothetical protein
MKTARLAFAFVSALGVLTVAMSVSANAATLVDLSGKVLVNAGNGFKVAKEAQSISVGSRVTASAGAQGVVQYDDGCRVDVKPGSVYTIAAKSPCALALNNTTTAASLPGEAGVLPAAGAVGGLSGPAALGVGGLAAAGAFGIAQAVNSTNKPSSP